MAKKKPKKANDALNKNYAKKMVLAGVEIAAHLRGFHPYVDCKVRPKCLTCDALEEWDLVLGRRETFPLFDGK